MIYIDPPYNTGNDFIYDDDFAENAEAFLKRSNQKDEVGNRLVANTEANGRFHSDWLSMMYPRLKLARNLLIDDGLLLVSIGEQEIDNLLRLTKEVFGEDNFVTTFLRQRKKKPSFLHSNVGSMFEYVVCIARNRVFAPPFSVDVTTAGKKYPLNNAGNSLGILTFPPQSVRFTQKSTVYEPQDMSEGNIITRLLDRVVVVDHLNVEPFRLEGEFRYSQSRLEEIVNAGEEITISKPPFRPNHVKTGGEIKKMHNLLTPETYRAGTNEDGTSELESLFGVALFDNPKPSSLIRILCQAVTYDDPDALIMDFFSGSGSSGDAVMQLNAEDGGNRKFIMVQIPEPCDEKSEAFKAGYKTIAEISKERIRRAGRKILEGECHEDWNKDVGFRVLKIDSSNMADVYYRPDAIEQGQLKIFTDNIKPDRNPEDLLFQVLLDWGVDLSLPIRKEKINPQIAQMNAESKTEKNNLRESVKSADKKSFEVFFVDENALVACFDTGVNEELVKQLAEFEPLRVVFRDNGFVSDAVKINVEQIFKQMSPGTEVKSI